MADLTEYTPAAGGITMFTTQWCSFCKRLKMMLQSTDIKITEVDIENTPGAEDIVKELNGGNAVVPTVIFADGSTATNPALPEVKERVAAAS